MPPKASKRSKKDDKSADKKGALGAIRAPRSTVTNGHADDGDNNVFLRRKGATSALVYCDWVALTICQSANCAI